ncbi:Translocon-associated protein subunit alpha-like protein, partial [Dinothrombium tinctorium]
AKASIFAFAAEEESANDAAVLKGAGDESEEVDESATLKPHPEVEAVFLFTKPAAMGLELPAGKDAHFLVGFENKAKGDFIVESMEASFRYAMDFSFHIQNFSTIAYNRVVKPKEEVTLAYSFFVSDAYSTRPYGLTVNLYYKDMDGNQFANAVFNETVSIVELDEGLDGETFFLYVFLVAFVVLILVAIQQFVVSKRRSISKPKIEVGTSNANDVDYDWLPQETLQALNKSPKVAKHTKQQSPRQRRVKRGTGSSDEK